VPTGRNRTDLQGKKMIRLTVRCWTNNIASGKGNVRPKHAWSSGVVKLEPNTGHGIRGGRPVVFRSLLELGSAIEKSLIAGGIRLHPSAKTKRYSAGAE
jgi:hypothetical protein